MTRSRSSDMMKIKVAPHENYLFATIKPFEILSKIFENSLPQLLFL